MTRTVRLTTASNKKQAFAVTPDGISTENLNSVGYTETLQNLIKQVKLTYNAGTEDAFTIYPLINLVQGINNAYSTNGTTNNFMLTN